MITKDELETLLAGGESGRVEFTASQGDTDKFSKAVCAFANDFSNDGKPGFLFIGVNDKGIPCGLKVENRLLEVLGGLRSDGNIQPLPVISVEKFALEGGDVAVVEVLPSDLPPVRFKGSVWIRTGPRKGIANEQEERILTERRISKARSFDSSPVMESSLGDISLPLFAAYREGAVSADVIESNHRAIEQQLASLRFYDTKHHCPTVGGLLIFGNNPRYYFPGAYIQFLKLPGIHLTDIPEDQGEISGDLFSVLRELDTRIKSNIHTTLSPLSGLREKTVYDFPPVAIRELLMNAVMHRDYQSHTPVRLYWYSDRIEIQSPGGLYGEVTLETLTTRNSYRNPVIAETMKELGFVNKFGYGIQRALGALRDNGSPEAEFQVDERIFLTIIPIRKS